MFRRAAPSRSSSASRHRSSGRTRTRHDITWTPAEEAAAMAAPGQAVSAGVLSGVAVSADDRRVEEAAVSARLDRAWRRAEQARAVTEGRIGAIGDDTARRDPLTQPFPIVFGTPARGIRPVAPAAPAAAPAAQPAAQPAAPHGPFRANPRTLRRPQAAITRRPLPVPAVASTGAVPRVRPPRPLTVPRWSAATG